jgi:hypothetical protein
VEEPMMAGVVVVAIVLLMLVRCRYAYAPAAMRSISTINPAQRVLLVFIYILYVSISKRR